MTKRTFLKSVPSIGAALMAMPAMFLARAAKPKQKAPAKSIMLVWTWPGYHFQSNGGTKTWNTPDMDSYSEAVDEAELLFAAKLAQGFDVEQVEFGCIRFV